MKINKILGGLLLLTNLVFVSPVLAGGGGVWVDVSSGDDPHWNVVRVYFNPSLFSCKGMVVSFNFANPVDGDKVSGSNGDNTSTIIEDPRYENVYGQKNLLCSAYAKVYSPKLELNRIFNISFKGNNLEGSRQVATSFGSQVYPSKPLILPWDESFEPVSNPTPPPATINAWILNQHIDSSSGIRQVTVKWGAFDGYPGTFSILGTRDKINWETLIDGQRGPSTSVNVKTIIPGQYFLKVHGCMDKWGTCADSDIIFLYHLELKGKPNQLDTPSQITNPSQANSDNSKLDNSNNKELEQKVASLEAKVKESEQKQNVLQQRVSDLISFIKRLFPFFK